jgi:ribose 5-phosphate isomerase B
MGISMEVPMDRVVIGSDHAGYGLKSFLVAEFGRRGIGIVDVGTDSSNPVDYVPFCIAVAETVVRGDAAWGIVVGGSGQGEQIAANKVRGARAALCNDPYYARLARRHNDANVIAMGARIVAPEFALEILELWTGTSFEGGRHQRRVDLISAYESRSGSVT